ncbi:hypothetical protein [Methanobrevibacter sp. DSM 116169]|uniref:hypothetical protein n=1 Tax=Methanobrevibacter sp. DSM 116169 TaxID=3242727 RepID=UPI0038FC11C1
MNQKNENLIKRGFFENKDLEEYSKLNEEELINLSKNSTAQKRAIAVNLLNNFNNSNKYSPYFLEILSHEKKLYVRLEIAKSLEKGNIETAKLMIPYLDKIPNKQYKSLPKKVSKKKTYLIPRDLIARILSKMDIAIFPLILELLCSNNLEIISESLDIFGYMVFHNQKLETGSNFKYLTYLFDKYKNNDLILWKITMCLSSFRNNDSISFLKKIKNFTNNEIINLEADRSIFLIKEKLL